jgi:hypothetical protein
MEKRSYEVDDAGKTRAQLLSELAALRRRVAQLEAGEADHKRVEVVLRENEGRFRQSTEDLRHVFAEELRVSREKLESSDQELRITSEQLHTTVEAQQFLNPGPACDASAFAGDQPHSTGLVRGTTTEDHVPRVSLCQPPYWRGSFRPLLYGSQLGSASRTSLGDLGGRSARKIFLRLKDRPAS